MTPPRNPPPDVTLSKLSKIIGYGYKHCPHDLCYTSGYQDRTFLSLNCKIICKGRKSRPENLGVCKSHATNVVLLFSSNNNNLKNKTFHESCVRRITTKCYLTSINFSQSVFLHPKFGHRLQTLKPVTGIFHSPN